jgi:hypothetical protein
MPRITGEHDNEKLGIDAKKSIKFKALPRPR